MEAPESIDDDLAFNTLDGINHHGNRSIVQLFEALTKSDKGQRKGHGSDDDASPYPRISEPTANCMTFASHRGWGWNNVRTMPRMMSTLSDAHLLSIHVDAG